MAGNDATPQRAYAVENLHSLLIHRSSKSAPIAQREICTYFLGPKFGGSNPVVQGFLLVLRIYVLGQGYQSTRVICAFHNRFDSLTFILRLERGWRSTKWARLRNKWLVFRDNLSIFAEAPSANVFTATGMMRDFVVDVGGEEQEADRTILGRQEGAKISAVSSSSSSCVKLLADIFRRQLLGLAGLRLLALLAHGAMLSIGVEARIQQRLVEDAGIPV